nr:WRKY transcription factor 35 [Manihot esculenta]
MEQVKASNWLDESEDELIVRELLDDESPFFLLPNEAAESKPTTNHYSNDQTISRLVSTVYSGPTIQDIDHALSFTSSSTIQRDQVQAASQACRISILEKGVSRIENNKYTLKLKTCGNGMADDGYKWRKYGQKSIKNSPYPRSYYKCTNPRCSAKKQVERSREDQDTLVVTYEGLHLHFAYPCFLLEQPNLVNPPPSKKPKKAAATQETAEECPPQASPTTGSMEECECLLDQTQSPQPQSQGLLEDIVPLMIRNPLSSNSSSCSSYPSPPTSPSSLSWSPHSCF